MRLRLALLLALALSAPSLALSQGPADESGGDEQTDGFWGRLSAAYWCEMVVGDGTGLGCDGGVGVALLRWSRPAAGDLILAAAVGRRSVVFGPAWSFGGEDGPALAVGVGVMAPYDGDGLRVDEAAPAVGATFRFGGGDG